MGTGPLAWPWDFRSHLAVVVLHYGDPRRTARLVAQMQEGLAPGVVRVLDNAAPIPFAGAWVRLSQNLFWGGALAWTVARARQEGFSHLWFLNDDLSWMTLRPIAQAWARLGEISAAIGPVAVYSPGFTAHPYHPQMVARPGGGFRTVRFCDGVAPLLHLDFLAGCGLHWEDNLPGYGVDVVLSARAVDLGWQVVVDHQLVARHVFHASARRDPGFLEHAARLEAAFLTRHLGPDFRERIQRWSKEVHEHSCTR